MPTGPQLADACNPQRARWSLEADGGVLNDANADRFHGLPHAIVVEPAVVVTEDGHYSSGSAKSRQLDHDLFRRHESATKHTLNDKVTQNADDVRLRGVGAIDRRVELGHPIKRRANMKIGKHRDTQGSLARPSEAQVVFCHRQTRRLEPERPETQDDDDTSDESGRPSPHASSEFWSQDVCLMRARGGGRLTICRAQLPESPPSGAADSQAERLFAHPLSLTAIIATPIVSGLERDGRTRQGSADSLFHLRVP